jgi:hypothetical protein
MLRTLQLVKSEPKQDKMEVDRIAEDRIHTLCHLLTPFVRHHSFTHAPNSLQHQLTPFRCPSTAHPARPPSWYLGAPGTGTHVKYHHPNWTHSTHIHMHTHPTAPNSLHSAATHCHAAGCDPGPHWRPHPQGPTAPHPRAGWPPALDLDSQAACGSHG